MEYVDPLPVNCDSCDLKSSHRVNDLFRLVATCSACGRSLVSIGLQMRARSDEARRLWTLSELVLALESEDVIIPDIEFDDVQTLRDLVDIVIRRLDGTFEDGAKSLALVSKAAHRAAAKMSRSLFESDDFIDNPLSSVFRPFFLDEPPSEYEGLAGDVG